jgi:hypothetical protein
MTRQLLTRSTSASLTNKVAPTGEGADDHQDTPITTKDGALGDKDIDEQRRSCS